MELGVFVKGPAYEVPWLIERVREEEMKRSGWIIYALEGLSQKFLLFMFWRLVVDGLAGILDLGALVHTETIFVSLFRSCGLSFGLALCEIIALLTF